MKERLASCFRIGLTRQVEETTAERVLRGPEMGWRVVILLVAIVVLIPHTISIERAHLTDSTYETVSWAAIVWAFTHTEGSNFAGPLTASVLSLPDATQFVSGCISLIASLYTFRVVQRFAPNPVLRRLGMQLVPAILFFLLPFGLFSVSLDGWMSVLTLPLPIAVVVGSAAVYAASREKG